VPLHFFMLERIAHFFLFFNGVQNFMLAGGLTFFGVENIFPICLLRRVLAFGPFDVSRIYFRPSSCFRLNRLAVDIGKLAITALISVQLFPVLFLSHVLC